MTITPTRFRRRPTVVDAILWQGEFNCEEVFAFLGLEHPDDEMDHSVIHIPTLEGTITAPAGDWIVRGTTGEFWPVKPEIFAATYEPAEAIR